MTRFIGISGKPGAVKEFFRFKILQELRFHGYSVVMCSLAEELYRQVNELIDQLHQLEDEDASEQEYRELADKYHLSMDQSQRLFSLLKRQCLGDKDPLYGYSRRNANMRQALELFALNMREVYGGDYLIGSMEDNTPGVDFAIFTDLRFPDEAQWLADHDGLALRVEVDVEAVIAQYSSSGGYKYSREGMFAPTETALDDYESFYIRFAPVERFDRVAFGREILDFYDLPHREETIR